MNFAVLDAETCLIQPSLQAPRPVCWVMDVSGQDELLHAKFDRDDVMQRLYWAFKARPVGAHLAFDAAVAMAYYPELREVIWESYDSYRPWDLLHAEKLIDLAHGRLGWRPGPNGAQKSNYNLGDIVERRFGHVMDKEGGWRTRFGTLLGTPVASFPRDAVDYVMDDVRWPRALLHAQLQAEPACLVDVARQSRAALWAYLMTCRGFQVDRVWVDRFEQSIVTDMEAIKRELVPLGLLEWNGKRNTKAAMARAIQICTTKGLKIQMTGEADDEGQVDLSKAACKEIGDPALIRYSQYSGNKTMLAKVGAIKDAAIVSMPIQSRFEVLVQSGRMACQGGRPKKKIELANRSSYSFQLHNLNKKSNLRGCFIARPGYWLGSLDFGQFELCGWAQVCLDLFGASTLAEDLNKGIDVHCSLGATMYGYTYEWVLANKKTDPKAKDARQASKAPNFGLPGGMGWKGLIVYAATQYDTVYTDEQSQGFVAAWKKLRPEHKPFFDFIRRCVDRDGYVVQLRSQRIRGGVGFTDGCNCVDYKTEALTKRGWVKGPDLLMSDELLTKNAATGKLEWQKPTGINLYPKYKGPLIEFKSTRFSALTTPNHRWLVYDNKKGVDRCVISDLISHVGDHRIHRTGDYVAPDGPYSDDFLRLVGWVLTDGSLTKTGTGIRIYQTKPKTVKMIDALFKRLGTHVRRTVRSERGAVVWSFSDNPLYRTGASRQAGEQCGVQGSPQRYVFADYKKAGIGVLADSIVALQLGVSLSQVGTVRKQHGLSRPRPKSDGSAGRIRAMFPDRLLTVEFVATLSKRQAQIVFDTMILGDGSVSERGAIKFYTRSESAANAFQMLCTLVGKASNAHWLDLSERVIKKYPSMANVPKAKGIWHVTPYRRDKVQVLKHQVREISARQGVWCPQVPNTYFVARREKTVYITGNTTFQGLAADAKKQAGCELSRACYTGRDSFGNRYPALHGSYIVNEIHDEFIFEFPEDRAHEAAIEAGSIMEREAAKWMPDVPPKVEPALMRRWAKDASPVYENGRLVPWEPKEKTT